MGDSYGIANIAWKIEEHENIRSILSFRAKKEKRKTDGNSGTSRATLLVVDLLCPHPKRKREINKKRDRERGG